MDEAVAFGDTGEQPKALIACHCIHTVEEFLEFALCKPKKPLLSRQEYLHAIVVIHDGCRVAGWQEAGIEVSDCDLTRRGRQCQMDRSVVPIDKS